MTNLEDIDFSQTQDETALVADLARELQPLYIIVEKSLAVKFPSGDRIKIPFDIPYEKVMDATSNLDTGASQADQLSAVLHLIGSDADVETIERQGFIAVAALADKYFTLWAKLAVSPGESKPTVS